MIVSMPRIGVTSALRSCGTMYRVLPMPARSGLDCTCIGPARSGLLRASGPAIRGTARVRVRGTVRIGVRVRK